MSRLTKELETRWRSLHHGSVHGMVATLFDEIDALRAERNELVDLVRRFETEPQGVGLDALERRMIALAKRIRGEQ